MEAPLLIEKDGVVVHNVYDISINEIKRDATILSFDKDLFDRFNYDPEVYIQKVESLIEDYILEMNAEKANDVVIKSSSVNYLAFLAYKFKFEKSTDSYCLVFENYKMYLLTPEVLRIYKTKPQP
jgi:hypothetical protein